MIRPPIKNRSFDRMGEKFATLIDPNHFLGRSSLDIHQHPHLPPVNILKKGLLFEMEVVVPGFKKEELEVSLQDDVLTIRGQKSYPASEKKGEYIMEEFDIDSFERKFKLARTIAHEKISAKYENGVLRLTFTDVPKEEEKAYQKVKVL
ncbi:MAG: Hsp20/alpha crystallin family protein [Lewinellaceae bacterium]|nr:Hsp20/alpha crystallin family protein [Lewinellaceae bacterium]